MSDSPSTTFQMVKRRLNTHLGAHLSTFARVILINSNRARSESKAPASRRGSKPLAAAHNGKKRNAEAGLLNRTLRERLFWASSCVLVLDKGVTIACARRLAAHQKKTRSRRFELISMTLVACVEVLYYADKVVEIARPVETVEVELCIRSIAWRFQ